MNRALLLARYLALALLACGGAAAQTVEWTAVQRAMVQHRSQVGCNSVGFNSGQYARVAPNGDLVVVGCASNGTDFDMFTARFSGATGAVLWTAGFTGARLGSPQGDDAAVALTIDGAGDVVVTGYDRTPNGGTRMRTIKYAGATGATLWNATFTDDFFVYYGVAVATDAAGDVFVTGHNFRTFKLAGATGATLWSYTRPFEPVSRATAIVVDANGDAYATGHVEGANSTRQMLTLKINGATGIPSWESLQPPSTGSTGLMLAFDPSGALVVAGYGTGSRAQVVKHVAATGQVLWSKPVDEITGATALGINSAGEVFVTGQFVDGASNASFSTAKLSGSTGAVIWSVQEPSSPLHAIAYGLAVDSAGNVAVTGGIRLPAVDFVARTIKYRGSDGMKLWDKDLGDAPQVYAHGYVATFDAGGNLLVAANVSEPDTQPNIRALKYSGTDGALLWASPMPAAPGRNGLAGAQLSAPRGDRIAVFGSDPDGGDGQISMLDAASGISLWSVAVPGVSAWGRNARVAIDGNGDIVFAAAVSGKLMVRKLAAATGATLWTANYRPGQWYSESPAAIAVDDANDIAVTGEICMEVSAGACMNDMHTWKFAGADGALLWDAHLTGSTGGGRGNAVTVDSQRHVIVVGAGHQTGSGEFSRTIKYHGTTGAVLWDKSKPLFLAAAGVDATVDAAGDVFALIYTENHNPAMRLIKYAGVDGAVLWEDARDVAGYDIAVLPGGDLALAYDVQPSYSGANWGALRYSGSTGTVLWSRTADSMGSADTAPYSLAVDAGGNLVTAGYVTTAGRQLPRLVKFHGPSGAVLFDSVLSADTGYASAVVTDAAGAIYVGSTLAASGEPEVVRITKLSGGPAIPPSVANFDFDADGRSDLLWQHADGRAAVWTMNGTAPTASAEIIGPGTGWSVKLVANISSDGRSDVVWQHADGRVAFSLMYGTVRNYTDQILDAGPWSVTHAPDLDGDGTADLVFQNADGTVAVWILDGSIFAGRSIIGAGTGWSVIRASDFDGDGKDDLMWRHNDGRHAIWLMNGTTVTATAQILNAGGWTATHTPDLNGDGKADIVWQHTDGTIAAWLMSGAAMTSGTTILNPASGWSVTRTGDFDGDGKADLFFLHADGRAVIYLMNGLIPTTTTQVLNAGSGWSAKRLLDLNGDGKADIVWENVDGRVAVWLMNGTAMTSGTGILGAATGWSVSGASQ